MASSTTPPDQVIQPRTVQDILLSVIVPVYNEERTISEILNRVRAVAIPKEIIVVDDYSTDGTAEALRAEARCPDTVVIRHPQNRGKGAAVPIAYNSREFGEGKKISWCNGLAD